MGALYDDLEFCYLLVWCMLACSLLFVLIVGSYDLVRVLAGYSVACN